MQGLVNNLKQKLARNETTLGLWVTLESPTITEIATILGIDWVLIDAEHGHLDFKDVMEHVRVTRDSGTTALVRIQELEMGVIKRMLDVGADGILIPNIASADEARQAVQFAKYPPWGVRGVGGERATHWGMKLKEYTQVANHETMVIPMIESVAAGRVAAEIASVRGVDAIFFGPVDFSASAGYIGQWEGPGVAQQILDAKDAILAQGVPCGMTATDLDDIKTREQQGFRMISLGADTGMLIRAMQAGLSARAKTATEATTSAVDTDGKPAHQIAHSPRPPVTERGVSALRRDPGHEVSRE
jgi:2-keto-3-deoxy-L-rhamnonate aldolase RhmA